MTLAYRVEELLALRDSVSESAVSLDKIDKEQALRGNLIFHLCQIYLLPAFLFPFQFAFSVFDGYLFVSWGFRGLTLLLGLW